MMSTQSLAARSSVKGHLTEKEEVRMKFPLQYRCLTFLFSKRVIEHSDDSRYEKRYERKNMECG